jgi:transforming growth factor-beta-induced protein
MRPHRLLLAIALLGALVLGAAPVADAHARHHRACPKDIVQTAKAAGDFSTLLSLVDKTGLTATLESKGPFTLFAPTNEAFAKLPQSTLDALAADPATLKKILLYHVVSGAVSSSAAATAGSATTVEGETVTFTRTPGGGLEVNNSNVVTPDIAASNGVIHAIDTVLTPPSLAPAPKDIVQTAVAAGQFTTLVSLLQKTGLDTVLEGAGPFTVFAPTDAAFAKLPQSTLDALAADPALLKKILLYHVLSGTVLAADAAKARVATTLEGDKVVFSNRCSRLWWLLRAGYGWGGHAPSPSWCGPLHVNNATIIEPNVLASNGVIHVIDTVLIPPAV